jgi:hypothetical protein
MILQAFTLPIFFGLVFSVINRCDVLVEAPSFASSAAIEAANLQEIPAKVVSRVSGNQQYVATALM